MKLIRFGADGAEKPGLVDNAGMLRDLSSVVSDISGETLLPENLEKLQELDPATLPLIEGHQRVGPCVGNSGKFICVGLNYSDHAAESGLAEPEEPVLFMKATTSICGPTDDVIIPPGPKRPTGRWSWESLSELRPNMLTPVKP